MLIQAFLSSACNAHVIRILSILLYKSLRQIYITALTDNICLRLITVKNFLQKKLQPITQRSIVNVNKRISNVFVLTIRI